MKYIIIVLIYFFCTAFLYANIRLSDYDLGNEFIFDMKTNGKIIVLLCQKEDIPGPYREPAVKVFDGSSWTELPSKLYSSGDCYETLLFDMDSQVNIDSSGNIWLTGYNVYCYRDTRWVEYHIKDELRANRSYGQFCVDIDNNLWLTTKIYNSEPKIMHSEIVKFDGESFDVKLRTNSSFSFTKRTEDGGFSSTIACLHDGRVVIYRVKNSTDEDYELDGSNPDLFFYSSDGILKKEVLKTISNPDDTMNYVVKVPMGIYGDSKDNLWVGLATQESYDKYPNPNKIIRCCSGLSMLSKYGWMLFDDSRGLDILNYGVYRPVVKIKEISDSKYLVIGLRRIYEMGSDFILRELDWNYILDNSSFIRVGDVFSNEIINDYLNDVNNNDNSYASTQFGEIIATAKGEIWIQTGIGIIVFDEKILSVAADAGSFRETIIYPNPASDLINIVSKRDFSQYEIINILGQTVSEGKNNNILIDIGKLPTGKYYLKLSDYCNFIKIIGFIKK